ncbi:hypothetical protein QN277_003225 [Acacia crassicarpa]|uniref:LOB domain-containing protein n=1 Tax=Acacia crassicarpa TaxID=499986 RepID=A0AAE1J1J8_9FABA|nr:hypothetical protein QN277_003225 [Acacia crassicarpa]
MSSSKTPCAACKLQRRKCTPECVFAPYFPPDIPQKFQNVHQVFGASNVSKILTDLDVAQREEAVRSLAYEADKRIQDPVYGCVGHIAYLQKKLRHLTNEIDKANKEIALYEGNHGFQPFLVPSLDAHHAGTTNNIVYGPSSVYPYTNMPPQAMMAAHGGGNLVICDPQQQLVAGDIDLRQVQELYGIYDQHQQPPPPQKDFMSYGGGGSVSGSGFNQAAEISASLALNTFDNSYQSVQLHGGQGGDCHQPQQNQYHHNHNLQEQLPRLQHHKLQESLQQPQQLQQQPQHHHLQKQMLLQPQPQHQEQSKDT